MPALPRIAAMLFALSALLASSGSARGQMPDEYRVKAGFVTTFARFVEWPADSFKGTTDPYRICVIGRSPFGTSLNELAEGKMVESRKLAIRPVADVHEAEGCHIVFVSSSEHLRLRSILETLGSQSILTVGDTSDFIAEGGIISLGLDGGRVRMEINADAAKERRLRISSRLLQLAKCVKR